MSSTIKEGTLLWEPRDDQKEKAAITTYMNWLREHKDLDFKNYDSLWNWSVDQVEDFWESLWSYFKIKSSNPYDSVLTSHKMPGAKWFSGASLNYTEHIFSNRNKDAVAIMHASETRPNSSATWGELEADTKAFQQTLKRLGVEKGDRIVAYVPNIYESVVAFLATASLGAIWSSASPDFGTESVMDRFQQIEPKVMITVDGYQYNGKAFNRMEVVENIQAKLPTLEATVTIPYFNQASDMSNFKNSITWSEAITLQEDFSFSFEQVEFNEPLWILFSSGTTGKPKPIVQSQGGILLEHLKAMTFHMDLNEQDRFFWYTTTGWMMWNFLVGGLLVGSPIVLYDGSTVYPDKESLWKFAEETKTTVFGTSASFITSCMKDGMQPGKEFNLQHLKNISSTGSPLPPEGFQWCYDNVKKDVWISSVSGGTDVCTAFILGVPTLPVYAGELQCRGLGARIESFNEQGEAVIDKVGELVLTAPFPSMPVYFWNDSTGSRLKDSYFDVFPGIWCHGDYLKITERHTCVIYGRSDATINRGGIRIGTSEIYRAVDQIEEVSDSLIVDIPLDNGDSSTPLFVVMKEGIELTEATQQKIKKQIREHCSPRHTPTVIHQVPDLPKTLNGKKLEIPVKKILMGKPVDEVVNKGSLSNKHALDYFTQFAEKETKTFN
ncbi:acetoacetate--CoA ligase [Oceanobacillus manasiensis]|uniref:acetoacetate--CoA ligase n=1 Tax=Oceanobacillus manasiensis TaxID=586413 RepID=UPI0005A6E751|nr:acetoacetate--CoA ligase [Oceanobacillus manasiensis]